MWWREVKIGNETMTRDTGIKDMLKKRAANSEG